MADSSVQIHDRRGEVEGQAQSPRPAPHDGRHLVDETVVHTDVVITDANSELAVQVPEGVGASTVGHRSPMGEALARGTAEEQFVNDSKVDEEDTASETEAPDVSGTTAGDDKK